MALADLTELGQRLIGARQALTGVQPKISLEEAPVRRASGAQPTRRLSFIGGFAGIRGHFILKPPTDRFPYLPLVEDVTMHLADHCGIVTAKHALIRLNSGELSYITRRFDRTKAGKLALEDLAQVTGTLTEYKYRSSMERVGDAIRRYSSSPGHDAVTFLDILIFCHLTGNADMHLKNFALLTAADGQIGLSPAYDLVATKLLIPHDPEETALPINGKKTQLRPKDFRVLAERLAIPAIVFDRRLRHFGNCLKGFSAVIKQSFLPPALQKNMLVLVAARAKSLGLIGA